MTREEAQKYVNDSLSLKENYMMGRCKHLVARNLSTAASLFIKEPNQETKDKYDAALKEVRDSKLSDMFFDETVHHQKNMRFIMEVKADEERRKLKDERAVERTAKEKAQLEKQRRDEEEKNKRILERKKE